MTAPPHDPSDDALRMSIWGHLKELRNRLIIAAIAVAIGTAVGFTFAGEVLDYLRVPYCQTVGAPEECKLVILGPTGGIFAYFRIALTIGAILAVPVITYQVLVFILPGLKRNEKRWVIRSLPAATVLFFVGVIFAWFILIPPALRFLEGFETDLFRPEWTADLYLGFVTALVFWMGVAFETPLIFFTLSLLGLLQPKTLIQNWRIAIVGSAIAAALITPTIDPVNMFLVMAPLLGLYIISIGLVALGSRISRVDPAPIHTQTT